MAPFFSGETINLHNYTDSTEVQNELIKDEYVVPRFLADCARSYGFQGIIFNSTKEPTGENLVIFNPDALREMGRIEIDSKPYLYHI